MQPVPIYQITLYNILFKELQNSRDDEKVGFSGGSSCRWKAEKCAIDCTKKNPSSHSRGLIRRMMWGVSSDIDTRTAMWGERHHTTMWLRARGGRQPQDPRGSISKIHVDSFPTKSHPSSLITFCGKIPRSLQTF